MVDMIECVVSLLGPDLEPLKEELHVLGKRHIDYGVSPKYFPVMEKAVIYTLEELLDDKFTRKDRNSWQALFHYMIIEMTDSMEE